MFQDKNYQVDKSLHQKYISSHQENIFKIVEILYESNEMDTVSLKRLILTYDSNNIPLKTILRMINMNDPENVHERRRINKRFLDCLVEVTSSGPLALIWLKKNIDYDICDIMLSDWKHSGKSKTNFHIKTLHQNLYFLKNLNSIKGFKE